MAGGAAGAPRTPRGVCELGEFTRHISGRRARRVARKAASIATAVGVGAAVGAAVMVAPLAWSTVTWADQYTTAGRLLPGTVVGDTDVGDARPESARDAVDDAVESALADTVTFTHDGERWATRGSELVADVDVDAAIERAQSAAESASLLTLARARWGEPGAAIDVDVVVRPDARAVTAVVADVADDVDRAARDATIAWGDDGAELVEHRPGAQVDRDAAADALAEIVGAVEMGDVELPVATEPVEVTTDEVAPLVDAVATTGQRALERTVTLTAADQEWRVSAGELGAVPDTAALLGELRQAGGAEAPEGAAVQTTSDAATTAQAETRELGLAGLEIADEAIDGFVDELAAEIDQEVRDARLDYADGWVDLVESRTGRELDRGAARDRIEAALRGEADTVELPVEETEPDRTRHAYHDVLLVRRGERKLYHYVDGEIARSWHVAVGGGGSPTPTGEFRIGAKRHSPTWYNPDPDGWGEDMPDRIGPGRTNPLGLRALNWTRNGSDTLIRFHGTANVSSIGTPASQGCVRLTNSDVVQLYDLVPSGTTIVSV